AAAEGGHADVAQDVAELEGEAERVGVLGGAFGAARARFGTEHAEGEPADGTGDAAAVDLQVVPGLVGRPADVHLDAVDELVEPAERDREPVGGVGERDGDRVGVVLVDRALTDPGEQLPGVLQPGGLHLAVQRAVADVVDPTGERVQRRHRPPLRRRQQPDAVGEVACLMSGDGLAVAAGGEYRWGRVRFRLHGPDHPLPRRVTPTSRSSRILPGLGGPGSTSNSAAAIASTAARPPATNPASSSLSRPWTLPTRGSPSSSRSRARCAWWATRARTDAPAVGA